jgi:drug/metabolite transporter (DMT)-like permease
MGELLATLALVMFSTNIILTKVASARVAIGLGFFVAVVVNVLFASLLVAVQVAFRQEPLRMDVAALLLFALGGFFSTYLGRWSFYDSVVKLGPSRASSFQASNPMFTALIAWLVLDEALKGIDVAAAAAVLLGLILTSHRPSERNPGSPRRPFGRIPVGQATRRPSGHATRSLVRSGVFLALFGSLSYAISNVIRGMAVRDWNEPVIGVLVGAIVGLVAYTLLGSEVRGLRGKLKGADRTGLCMYVVSGVLTILAQACMVAAMRYSPVPIVALITLSTPVLVIPLGYFLLKNRERIVPRTVAGSVVILAGIAAILLT